MGTTTAVKRITGAGVALPQGIIGLAVDAADLLPLLQDGADTVTGGLPLGGVRSYLLRFSGQLFLLRNRFLAAAGLVCLSLLTGLNGVLDDRC